MAARKASRVAASPPPTSPLNSRLSRLGSGRSTKFALDANETLDELTPTPEISSPTPSYQESRYTDSRPASGQLGTVMSRGLPSTTLVDEEGRGAESPDEITKFSRFSVNDNWRDASGICKAKDLEPVTYTYLMTALEAKVESLDLRNHGMTSIWGPELRNSILGNAKLKSMDLGCNDLRGEGIDYLYDSLVNNNHLEVLDVSHNNIGSLGAHALTKVFESDNVLRKLDASGNGLTDTDTISILNALCTNETLQELNLRSNSLGDESADYIQKLLSENETIHSIDLSWNDFTHEGVDDIFRCFRFNKTVRTFALAGTKIDDTCLEKIESALLGNKHLTSIDFSGNYISDMGIKTFIDGYLSRNPQLKVLNLGENLVTSSGTLYLLEALSTLKCNLAHLDLTGTFGDDEVRIAFEKVKRRHRNFLLTGLTGPYRVLGVATQDALQFYLERNTLVVADS